MSGQLTPNRPVLSRLIHHLWLRARQRREAAGQLLLLMRHAGPGLVAATAALHLTVGLLPIVFLVCVGRALQLLADSGQRLTAFPVGWWLAAGLVAFLAQQLLAPVQLAVSQLIARRVDRYCLNRFTTFALTRAPLATLEQAAVADRLSQANEAFEEMSITPGAATEGALALIARYGQLAGAVTVVAVSIGPWAAAAAAFVALVARRGQSSAFYRWGQLVREFGAARRRMVYVRDLATGTRAAKEIRTLGLIDWVDARYTAESRAYLGPLWAWRRRVYGPPFALYAVLGLAGTVAALLAIARFGATPAVPVAAVPVAAVAMAVRAVVVCARFGVFFPESDTKMVYGRSAWEALLEFEEICQARERDRTDDSAVASAPRATVASAPRPPVPRPLPVIAFENVSFSYPSFSDTSFSDTSFSDTSDRRPVLRALNLSLPPGTSTALVGVNGAGKTTLVKLLTGLYRPDEGRVTVGGTDLAGLDPQDWRHHVAVTFQDYVRYEMSLRDNVAMSAIKDRDDDDGLRSVLSRVGLDKLLSLPAGLDTPLTRATPGGRELSGGQWQRLALARSLFAVRHGASVLILDEPTAQLDARGEADFYDMFLDLTRGTTSLVISHRFSSVRRADRIVVLDGGTVTESGTHDELVAAEGTYARLFAVQAKQFVEAGEPR